MDCNTDRSRPYKWYSIYQTIWETHSEHTDSLTDFRWSSRLLLRQLSGDISSKTNSETTKYAITSGIIICSRWTLHRCARLVLLYLVIRSCVPVNFQFLYWLTNQCCASQLPSCTSATHMVRRVADTQITTSSIASNASAWPTGLGFNQEKQSPAFRILPGGSGRPHSSQACQYLEHTASLVCRCFHVASSLRQSTRQVGLDTEHWTCWCKLRALYQIPIKSTDKSTNYHQQCKDVPLISPFWVAMLLA